MVYKKSLVKNPSAWVPIAMSACAIALLLFYFLTFGVVHEKDEGVAAHLWQILMGGQVPIIAFFAVKYLPENPKQAFIILLIQLASITLACAPVFIFKL